MRQNGGWRGKGAWDGDIEKTTVVLTGVPKILGAEILLSLLDRIFFWLLWLCLFTYGHGEDG